MSPRRAQAARRGPRPPGRGGAVSTTGLGLAMLVLAGCAGVAPAPAAAPAASHRATARATGARPAAPAVADSSPSPEALAVLSRIPEPLPESERVPPPAGVRPAPQAAAASGAAPVSAGSVPASGPGAATAAAAAAGAAHAAADRDSAATGEPPVPDTTATAAAESTSAVPVPAPTLPLGDREGAGAQALPESALVPRTTSAAPQAAADTCWRLQVGAPPEKAKAESLVKLASSQLLTAFVIDHEKGRYKVRSSDCLSRAGAESLRQRSVRSGFKGAFLVAVPPKAKKP